MSEVDRDPHEHAASKGCIVVWPEADELFVDIDTEEQAEAFFRGASILSRLYSLSATSSPSPSAEPWHFHVRVRLHPTTAGETIRLRNYERIALQAMLGSDLTREALSWLRFARGMPDVTVFFEKAPTMVQPITLTEVLGASQ